MSDIYSEILINHYKHPFNYGKPSHFHKSGEAINEMCGDELQVYILTEENKIDKIFFTGNGCAICLGTMSILSEELEGKSLERLKEVDEAYILKKINMKPDSSRIKCATLSLDALHDALSA